jgi:TPP-dependent pyruvate/acetoin dehydrogenase alpha subunit
MAIKAEAYGMPGVRVDGNDILAVYRVCKEAVDRARKGEGPTLVETVTHRMASHSSSDDAARYRDAKEYEAWKKKDPIARFQLYLKHKKLWTESVRAGVRRRCEGGDPSCSHHAEALPNPERRLAVRRRVHEPDAAAQGAAPASCATSSRKGGVGADVGAFPL